MFFDFLSAIVWIGFVEVLALGLLPLWSSLLGCSAEKVLGYSRVLSLLCLTWITWLVTQYAEAPFALITILPLTAALLLASHIILRCKFTSWRIFLYDQNLRRPYLSYGLAFLAIVIFRACSPEIFWGEKPLDFSLFNYLSRETRLPAEHPWAAGSSMSYYYMGFFSLAILQKISMLDPSVGYNISIALVGANLFACCESVLLNLRLSKIAASLGALLIAFGSNLNPVYLALVEGKALNFDTFWLTTRNFTSPAFAEYPLWSILFADLHPHVMSMPVVMTLLGLSFIAAFQPQSINSHRWILTLLCGFLWGLLYTVNGWDFVSTAIVLAIIFGFSQKINFSWDWFKLQIGYVVVLSAGAASAVIPFRASQKNLFAAYWGWVVNSEYNELWHVLLHQGGALSLIFLSTLGLVLLGKQVSFRKYFHDPILFALAAMPIVIGILSAIYSSSGQAWWIIGFSVAISLVAIFFLSQDHNSTRLRFCCLMVLAGANLLSISETFYLIDRMNTIFKGYQLLWPLFGISAYFLLSQLAKNIASSTILRLSFLRSSAAYVVYSCCFVVIALMFVGSIINLIIMLPMHRTSNTRYSLYGTSYLEKDNADEAYLIRWIQNNVKGKAYIAEASGDSYQAFTRITMHTGLPSLLGWEHHSRQGGVAQQDLEERKIAIRTIFSGINAESAYDMLQYFGIDFVIVSKLERETYTPAGLRKFSSNPQYFIPVAWQGNDTLYLTNFSPLKSELVKN